MRTTVQTAVLFENNSLVGMKPLSERDENLWHFDILPCLAWIVGMKPLSERDENSPVLNKSRISLFGSRNEATL